MTPQQSHSSQGLTRRQFAAWMGTLCASTSPRPTAAMTQQPSDLDTLRALNARFIHNFVTNDVPSHSAITHERFVCISTNGSRQSRAVYLHHWATGFDPEVIVYWDVRDEFISLFGDMALVRATNKYTRRVAGKEVTGMTTYTDTYVREGANWLCVQAQLTAVAPDQYPGDETIVNRYIKGVLQKRG
jgi:hypothetical protein